MQPRIHRVGRESVKIGRNRADVFCDRPFVVVEYYDKAFRLGFSIVERFVANPTSERGITRDHDDVFIAASQITPNRHSKSRRQSGTGVSRAVAIVFALRPQEKAVQALILPHGPNAIEPAREHFMDVALMANVENQSVLWCVENAVERDRQFDDTKVGTEMPAGSREHLDQLIADFLRKLGKILLPKRFHVCRPANAIEQACRSLRRDWC